MYADHSSTSPPIDEFSTAHPYKHSVARLRLLNRPSFVLLFILLTGCGGGGIAALVASIIPGGASSLPAIAPLLFVAGGESLPAVILPFTSELKAVAVTPDGSKLYAVDSLHDSVSVFDLSTNDVSAIVDVGSNPVNISITPDGSRAFVVNSGSDNVSVIDTNTEQVVATIAVGDFPFGVAITPNGSKAYVTNRENNLIDGSVSVIGIGSGLIITTIPVGKKPTVIAVTPDGSKTYVINELDNSVSVIDVAADQVLITSPVGTDPVSMAITPDSARVYVTNEFDNNVSILDGINVFNPALTIPDVGVGPSGIVISPDGLRAYVANANPSMDSCNALENTLTVLDLTTNSVFPGAKQIEVGKGPLGMVITGDGAKLYSLSACTNALSILATALVPGNTASAVSNIFIDGQIRSTGISIAPDGSQIYLAHPNAISRIQIATDTVVATIPARGRGPTELTAANTPSGPRLYTANSGNDTVSVIDLNSLSWIGTLPVGSRPSHIAITPDGTKAYVANSGFSRRPDDSLSVIDIVNNHAVSSLDLNRNGPIRIGITGDGTKALITHFGDFFPSDSGENATVTILDVSMDQISKQIVTAPRPSDVQITGNNQIAYVPSSSVKVSEVADVDLTSPNFTFNFVTGINNQPVRTAITSDNQKAVVTNYAGHSVSVVNMALRAVSATIPTGGPNPSAIKLTPDDSKAYILNSGDRSFNCGGTKCEIGNSVSVLNLGTNGITNVTVGKKPIGVAFANNKAYVSNFFDNSVSIINTVTDTVINTLPVGVAPVGVTSLGTRVYVANSLSSTVSVIDANQDQVIGTIPVNP